MLHIWVDKLRENTHSAKSGRVVKIVKYIVDSWLYWSMNLLIDHHMLNPTFLLHLCSCTDGFEALLVYTSDQLIEAAPQTNPTNHVSLRSQTKQTKSNIKKMCDICNDVNVSVYLSVPKILKVAFCFILF